MPTSYHDIYDRFLIGITDYDYLSLPENDLYKTLQFHLNRACTYFSEKTGLNILERDSNTQQFITDLDDDVIDILVDGMLYYWISPQVLNVENFKNVLNTKDYSLYSPANLLQQLRTLRNDLKKSFYQGVIDYTYEYAMKKKDTT